MKSITRPGCPIDRLRFFRRAAASGAAALLILAAGLVRPVFADEKPLAAKPETAAENAEPEGGKRVGFSIRLPLPITGETARRVRQFVGSALKKAQTRKARPFLIFEFDVPPGEENFGGGSEYTAALDVALTLTGKELAGAETAAYITKPIHGHALLAVIACDNVIMAPDASLDASGIDKDTITRAVRSAYRDIAQHHHHVPEAVVLGMLDPALEIFKVKTAVGAEYVLSGDLETLKNTRTVNDAEVFKRAGEPLKISALEARSNEFAGYLASNRRELAHALDLPASAIGADPSLENPWKAARVELKGPITAHNAGDVQTLIAKEIDQHGANFICLSIESPGGSPDDSRILAEYLASLDPSQIRTVAYIPKEARSDAALIALACDQTVMLPHAALGGPGNIEIPKDEIETTTASIRDSLAPQRGRSWSLWAAMIDPNLDVYRCARSGDVEYFSNEELAEQPHPDQWTKGEKITEQGRMLRLSGDQAQNKGLAFATVENFSEFKLLYGLQNDPTLLEIGWAQTLLKAMRSKGFGLFVLFIGISGLYLEFHSPGLGIGLFAAVVCFVLFFWIWFLNGAAGWLVALLLLSGVACLLMEIFVIPGFVIFGLGGGIMIILSLILAGQILVWPNSESQLAEMRHSLLMLGGAIVGLVAAALLARRWLPETPFVNRMILAPPADDEREIIGRREMLVDLHNLLGARGVTATPLMPGGKARLGDSLVDVIADGETIDRDRTVEVVEVRGNRVVVREVLG
jgi:membrane-bound ClpP family serine protease